MRKQTTRSLCTDFQSQCTLVIENHKIMIKQELSAYICPKKWKVSEEITFMSTNERIERLLKEHLYFMVYFL